MNETAAKKRKHDLAYCCFFAPAAVVLIASIGSAITTDTTVAAGVGFFVLIPLAMVALATVPIGVYYSFKLRKDPALLLLSLATAIVVAVVVTEAGSVDAIGLMYGVLVVAVEMSWFLLRRKREYPPNAAA